MILEMGMLDANDHDLMSKEIQQEIYLEQKDKIQRVINRQIDAYKGKEVWLWENKGQIFYLQSLPSPDDNCLFFYQFNLTTKSYSFECKFKLEEYINWRVHIWSMISIFKALFPYWKY